jgi:hypothetical protein
LKDLRQAALRMPDQLLALAGLAIDTIKINEIKTERLDDRIYWVKRRRKGSSGLIHGANLFFRLANNPVSVFVDLDEWRRWEIDSFQLLNGDRYRAFAGKLGSVWADHLPGVDLSTTIKRRALTIEMLRAAGAELARAHMLWSDQFGSQWSHGDPHLGNFIFDRQSGRARLIDFETMHRPGLPAQARHADDLKVLLLDMLGRVSDAEWPLMAKTFLRAYGNESVIRSLRERFVMPFGFGRLWWAIRTSYVPGQVIRKRLKFLHEALA